MGFLMADCYIYNCINPAVEGMHVCLEHGVEEAVHDADPPEDRGD